MLRILILVFAVGAAGGAAFLTMNASQPAPTQQTAQPAIPTKDVLVATQTISGGEVLSPDKMRWKPWPENELNDQFITRDKAPDAIGDLAGSFVNRAFGAGEPIRRERLMETNANLMSNKITPGKRAAAVKITAENTAGGFILPGDRVDVIHTITKPGANGQPSTNVSEIIISNVRVLAIDQNAVQSPEGSAIGKTATLELSPEDAERVMAAEASGFLSLALRAVTDHAESLQDVLVVVDPIEEGDMLTDDNLVWAPVSNPQMHPQFIRRDEQPNAIRDLAGSFVDRAFTAGEALRESRIMKVNVNLMSHRLEPGKRAAAVKISAEKTAGGFILPGDRVDVIHTLDVPEQNGKPKTTASEIIVRNVRVLAIDQSSTQTAEGAAIGKTATLELSPRDARLILAAEESGILTLALRSIEDHSDGVIEVLAANGDIPAGSVLGAEHLVWMQMPDINLHPKVIRRDEQPNAIREMLGAYVDQGFDDGEPLRTTRLIQVDVDLMSHRLRPGYRAAAVKISAEKTAGGFILPGDRVDVIHTIEKQGEEGTPPTKESEIIIRNVRVLAIDQIAAQTSEGSAVGETATLELKPDDAERIMAAEASGVLALALRSVTDHAEPVASKTPPKEVHTVRVHRANETQTVTLR